MKKLILLMAVVLMFSVPMMTGAITLQNANSSTELDPYTDSGMYDWNVDGVNHLYQQWFWYREDGTMSKEAPISDLNLMQNSTFDMDGDGLNEVLRLRYQDLLINPNFEIITTYTLLGGQIGSNSSDIGEQIVINNLSDHSLSFHLFEYTDFDLNGTPDDDTATHTNTNCILQTDSNGGICFSETAVTTPQHWAIDYFNFNSGILFELSDNDVDNLTDMTSGITGDVTFAFQWDDTDLNRKGTSGSSMIISKNKKIGPQVPEPGTMLLIGSLATGLFGFAGLRKRFKA